MPTINELTETDTVSNGDYLPIYTLQGGDARKVPMRVVADYMREQSVNRLATVYAAPEATAFSVAFPTNSHLILTPDGAYADGAVVLDSAPADRDEVLLNTTQAVTTFVVNGNGRTVVGAPTTMAANGFFRLKYDAVLATWYRVG
jgi:hypothetical protein